MRLFLLLTLMVWVFIISAVYAAVDTYGHIIGPVVLVIIGYALWHLVSSRW